MRLLFSSMRNEGPQVLEWIAYHLSIGFDHIMIATNDCDDGSKELIEAVGQIAPVSHLANDDLGGKSPQNAAYARLQKTDEFARADYLMILDADEFLNIHTGDINALTSLMGAHDVLGINWACFGPSGETAWRNDWVPARFYDRLVPAWGLYVVGNCKSLIQKPQRFERFFNHAPGKMRDGSDIRVLRDFGESLVIPSDGKARDKMRMNFAYQTEYRHAQINHYMTKTLAEFRLRIERGRGHKTEDVNSRHTQDYLDQFNGRHEMTEDRSIDAHLPKARDVFENLLENERVRERYEFTLSNFKTKILAAHRDHDAHSFKI